MNNTKNTNQETTNYNDDFDNYLGFANIALKDKEGFVRGKLVQIKKEILLNKGKNTQDIIAKTQNCLKFSFEMEGSDELIQMTKITGVNIRHEKMSVKVSKKDEVLEYNTLTELCLKLNLIQENELENRDEKILSKLSQAIKGISKENPIYIKAKLMSSDNNDSIFETIDIRTIKLIEKF